MWFGLSGVLIGASTMAGFHHVRLHFSLHFLQLEGEVCQKYGLKGGRTDCH
jgi:hypothetical protein